MAATAQNLVNNVTATLGLNELTDSKKVTEALNAQAQTLATNVQGIVDKLKSEVRRVSILLFYNYNLIMIFNYIRPVVIKVNSIMRSNRSKRNCRKRSPICRKLPDRKRPPKLTKSARISMPVWKRQSHKLRSWSKPLNQMRPVSTQNRLYFIQGGTSFRKIRFWEFFSQT